MKTKALLASSVFVLACTTNGGLYSHESDNRYSHRSDSGLSNYRSWEHKQEREEPKMLWGAHTGDTEEMQNEFETVIGKTPDFRVYFVHWGNNKDFPVQLSESVNQKEQTLVLFWVALDYNQPNDFQPKFSYEAILRGDFDSYFKEFALAAEQHQGPIILVPFEEFNDVSYPWSITKPQNTKTGFIDSFRYMREFFRAIPNIKFAWSLNAESEVDNAITIPESYYPGDEYVDYIGVDGFNFGTPWLSFDQIFTDTLNRVREIDKPLLILSMASAQGPEKPTWITESFKRIKNYPEIIGWVWFNENKEHDWRVWSDPESLNRFNEVVSSVD